MKVQKSQPVAKPEVKPESKPKAEVKAKPEPKVKSTGKTKTPADAPKSTGPKSKEQQLKDLLDLYKADKISPREYHERRAKILFEQ